MFVNGFYHLYNPFEKEPVLAYYYKNPDTGESGFGFNIVDGGGFLPESDLSEETTIKIVELREVELNKPEKTGKGGESTETHYAEKVETLKEMTAVQCSDGNWNYSEYMHGMANGIIFALSIFEGGEPEYLEAPDVWLKDIPNNEKPVCISEVES